MVDAFETDSAPSSPGERQSRGFLGSLWARNRSKASRKSALVTGSPSPELPGRSSSQPRLEGLPTQATGMSSFSLERLQSQRPCSASDPATQPHDMHQAVPSNSIPENELQVTSPTHSTQDSFRCQESGAKPPSPSHSYLRRILARQHSALAGGGARAPPSSELVAARQSLLGRGDGCADTSRPPLLAQHLIDSPGQALALQASLDSAAESQRQVKLLHAELERAELVQLESNGAGLLGFETSPKSYEGDAASSSSARSLRSKLQTLQAWAPSTDVNELSSSLANELSGSPKSNQSALPSTAEGDEERQFSNPTSATVAQPWHASGNFHSLQAIPAERAMSGDHWLKAMSCDSRVHLLDPESLRYKFGEWFMGTYVIHEHSCVGVGSTATVFSGEMMRGTRVKRVAFKVMNQAKTAANASLFLDRSVLTELEVHHLLQQTLTPAQCKHLLVTLDCQIYPPLHPVFAAIQRSMPSIEPTEASTVPGEGFHMLDGDNSSRGDDSERHNVEGPLSIGREIRFQVITVSPLCELGGLLRLFKGKTSVPTRAFPHPALADVIDGLPPRHHFDLVQVVVRDAAGLTAAQVRERFSSSQVADALIDGWGVQHRAVLRATQMAAAWMGLLKVQLLLQVCDGLGVLHRVGVVHCDVKLDNVFLTYDDNSKPFRITAKLGDLGMCRYLDSSKASASSGCSSLLQAQQADGPVPGMLSAYTGLVKGTPGYCAPEMLEFGRLAPETDIYSLAVLCALALAPESDFGWFESWIMKLHFRRPASMSDILAATLRAGLSFNRDERPTLARMKAALQHEFVCLAKAVNLAREEYSTLVVPL